jgi:glutathione S-transferase
LAAKVDEVLDAATAITNEIFYDSRGKEGDDKLRARQALTQDYLPKWLGFLERVLNENAESGWFVGKSMSIADLAMWRLLGWLTSGVLDGVPTNILENFTGLQQLHNRVDSLPKVGKWMERHYGK